MGRQDEMVKERMRKLKELREQGINPYPYSFKVTHHSHELQQKYKEIKPGSTTKDKVTIAGRVMSIRDIGKIFFASIQDGQGKIQVIFQDGETPLKTKEFFKKYADSGDFFGFSGNIFRTQRGELTVMVNSCELLTKSMLALPEKWHGLQDKEERYRKRYLDLIMNPEVKEVFLKREKIIDTIRLFLKGRGFTEIDTPYLQTIYGGAEARPFKTHLNALDIPLFLAISPELYLKRLIVGGFDKVFTMARNFRNEGIDRWHNPEFTMMEVYQAYADYNDMMRLLEDMCKEICLKVIGTTKVKHGEHILDFKVPWKRITMADAIKEYAGIDVLKMEFRELREFAEQHHVEYKGSSWGLIVTALFEHFCEEHFIQPTFVIDHPKETTPLCKAHRTDPRLIERFEPFCAGAELANAYSELNDPEKQKTLLEEQQEMLKAGDDEANPYDEDFVEALGIGMPPTGGLGVGIDRLVILLTEQQSIRDVIPFPFMRPTTAQTTKKEAVSSPLPVSPATSYGKLPLTRPEALKLLKEHNKDKADMNHYLESEAVMRGLAKRLGEPEEYWGMLGLLHDVDWGHTKKNSKEHLTKAPEILKKAGFDEQFISAVVSHGYGFACANLQSRVRTKQIEYALAASETITGLIHAYALMRKSIVGMDSVGLKKKFKDKKFAAAINREIIQECEKLGISLDEFFTISISAIASISKEVGLN